MNKGFANPRETWDARFSSDEYIFGTEPNVWLAQHADLFKPGMRVLAVADGEGRNSVWMAQQGLQVDAFDISPVGIAKAKKLAEQQGDYDAVVAIFIQFADPDTRATLFKRMKSALKPDGVILLQGYTPKQLEYKTGGPPNLSHLYTEELLQDAFGDLDVSELTSYEQVLTEGTQHHGQSALIGLVARRPFGCNFQ
jgi:cyclopropane fatty-acyl-phospholipid synthase-like methyltransferase